MHSRRRGQTCLVALASLPPFAVLIFDAGVPIFPELTAERDAIKRQPTGGLTLCRDCRAQATRKNQRSDPGRRSSG
jgi:hypothetical protein